MPRTKQNHPKNLKGESCVPAVFLQSHMLGFISLLLVCRSRCVAERVQTVGVRAFCA